MTPPAALLMFSTPPTCFLMVRFSQPSALTQTSTSDFKDCANNPGKTAYRCTFYTSHPKVNMHAQWLIYASSSVLTVKDQQSLHRFPSQRQCPCPILSAALALAINRPPRPLPIFCGPWHQPLKHKQTYKKTHVSHSPHPIGPSDRVTKVSAADL